jgi:phage terminase large subunit
MQIPLTQPQEQFVFSGAKYPAIVGGLGSGKTQGGVVRAGMLLLSEPGISVGYYLPTYDLIRLRAMPGIEEFFSRLGIRYKLNKSEFSIHAKGYGTVILRSYDNPSRIISYEVAHSIVDELDTLPAEKAAYVFRKVDERNRQHTKHPAGNTIGNVTTPDQGYSGFTYLRWVKDPLPHSEIIKAPTTSNPYLPPGYVDQIRNNYDPLLAEMYINGEFVSLAQNKVYHFFNRTKHHTTRTITDDDTLLHVGLDFNVGGTCATVWVIENNRPVAVDEFVSQHTQDFTLRAERYRTTGRGDRRHIIVYPDASGDSARTNASRTDIQIIRDAGFQIDCPPANPEVRDRVNSVNALFSHGRIAINTDKCANLTSALESQGYDKKGNPEKFEQHPGMDDWTDCAGYFLHRKFPIVRPMTSIEMSGF